jgi:hypothetical protein
VTAETKGRRSGSGDHQETGRRLKKDRLRVPFNARWVMA